MRISQAHAAEMEAIKETVRASLVCSNGGSDEGRQWLHWTSGLCVILLAMGAFVHSRLKDRREQLYRKLF